MSNGLLRAVLIATAVCFFGCSKRISNGAKGSADRAIVEASQYFTDNLASVLPGSKSPDNIRLSTQRALLWDSAYTVQGTMGTLVVVPVKFNKALYMQTVFSGPVLFDLNEINKLVFYKDSSAQYHCLSVTQFPDSNYLAHKSQGFTGVVLNESWDGSISQRYRYNLDGSISMGTNTTPAAVDNFTLESRHATKETDVIISQCSGISGYNYSADNPDDTYSWSESSCSLVYISDPISRPPALFSLAPGGGGGGGIGGLSIVVVGGTKPIPNIAQYFGCFTMGDAPINSYSVQVCVDQPDPGTRTPWSFSDGGLGSSLLGSNPVNVGHTFLVLTENAGGTVTTRNVGFYPATFVSPTPPRYATTQGMLNDDEDHGYNISLTVTNLSSSQFQAILNAVSLGNNPGYSYDINSDNCTTFAINALATAGINLPSTQGTWPGGSGDDPGDLGEDIRNMSLGSNMTRSTVSNPHPNTGTCQ